MANEEQVYKYYAKRSGLPDDPSTVFNGNYKKLSDIEKLAMVTKNFGDLDTLKILNIIKELELLESAYTRNSKIAVCNECPYSFILLSNQELYETTIRIIKGTGVGLERVTDSLIEREPPNYVESLAKSVAEFSRRISKK